MTGAVKEVTTSKLTQYATQANALLSVVTAMIIAVLNGFIATQNQVVTLVVLGGLWSMAYIFRLQEKNIDKAIIAKVNADIELMNKRLDIEIEERRRTSTASAIPSSTAPKPP